MSETEVFTATATGIHGVRVGEDHVSGTEDGKLGNAVLVELTNTLAVPLELAKKTVCAQGQVLTGIKAEADAKTGKICNLVTVGGDRHANAFDETRTKGEIPSK